MAANPSIQLGTDGNWAIKEDNLLAYKKDGTRFFNKEFDFTRGSLATFVDKDGLIKVSGVTDTELVVNGDFATDSDWFKTTGWSISNGQAIANTGAYNTLQQVFPIVLGKTYEVKFDVTSITSGSVSMTLGADSGLQRNQIGSYTEIIEYNNFFASSGPRSGAGGFVGSIDNVSVKEIQTDVPRIDFTDDATGHLLLEPQSTNRLTYSEDFTQSIWTNARSSGATNQIIAPDGTTTGYKLIDSTDNNTHLLYSTQTVTTSSVFAFSVFLKKGSLNNAFIAFDSGINQSVVFDLQNGTIVSTGSDVTSSKIESFDNDWYRCSFTHTPTNTSRLYRVGTYNGNISYAGSGSDFVYCWGAQLEQQSFATSYIPTSGSTATRNAEVCNNSGSAQDFNSEEGVLYAEIASLVGDETIGQMSISNGSDNETVKILWLSANQIRLEMKTASGTNFVKDVTVVRNGDFYKLAIQYKSNDYKVYVNGISQAVTQVTNTPSGLIKLNFDRGDGASVFYGKTKNLKVFKRALSDGELYLLTVTQYQSYQEMATALNYTL